MKKKKEFFVKHRLFNVLFVSISYFICIYANSSNTLELMNFHIFLQAKILAEDFLCKIHILKNAPKKNAENTQNLKLSKFFSTSNMLYLNHSNICTIILNWNIYCHKNKILNEFIEEKKFSRGERKRCIWAKITKKLQSDGIRRHCCSLTNSIGVV